MFSSHVGFNRPVEMQPILQKVYLYLAPDGELGITKKEFQELSAEFTVTCCQKIKKNLCTTKTIVAKILEDCKLPLELYLYVDDMSFTQIVEELEIDERAIVGENIYTYQEATGKQLDDRVAEIRNYLNINESAYTCSDEKLKYNIYLELNKVPISASAISFLMSVEDAIAPCYEEIVQIQAKFQKYNDFPFEKEIYLADVTALFDR